MYLKSCLQGITSLALRQECPFSAWNSDILVARIAGGSNTILVILKLVAAIAIILGHFRYRRIDNDGSAL